MTLKEFPVPIADTGTGIFRAEDSAIQFMRWIRKQLAVRAEWERERKEQAGNIAQNQTGQRGSEIEEHRPVRFDSN